MNTTWQAFLAAQGAHIDSNGFVTDFGNAADEQQAAQNGTVLVPLAHLATIECSGEDATTFLHNQLTSDINHLTGASAQYSAWCTHKGRMQASFLLFRRPSAYRALVAADLAAATLKRLQMYVLRSKVVLKDVSDEVAAIGICGPHAAEALGAAALPVPDGAMATADFADGTVIRLDARRLIVVAATAALPALFEALARSLRPVGTPAWQWADIQAGLVMVTALTKEEFVPQMVNFDKIGGVSFHKGCYPGQEVIARTKYLGKIKRHLYRLHADRSVAAGTPLYAAGGGEPCGLLASVAPAPGGGFDALAVIKDSAAENDDMRLEIPGVAVSAITAVEV